LIHDFPFFSARGGLTDRPMDGHAFLGLAHRYAIRRCRRTDRRADR
jgi:hypothetical protein